MKTLYKTILAICAFCFLLPSAFAQNLEPGTYEVTNGIAYNKSVTGPNADGEYTIKLETFVVGDVKLYNNKPADIALVLDVSGSMAFPKGAANRSSVTSLSYDDLVNHDSLHEGKDYFVYDSNDNLQQIYVGYDSNDGYYLFINHANPTRISGYTNSPSTKLVPNRGGYTRTIYEGTSRINALKDAVNKFIDEIDKNDRLDANGQPRKKDGKEITLGNQIAIIKFAGTRTNSIGNDVYYDPGSWTRPSQWHSYTQVVKSFDLISGNVESLKEEVNKFIAVGGTNAQEGLELALNQLHSVAGSNSSKTVVFFTDGQPNNMKSGVTGSAFDNVINAAYSIKNQTYSVNLFSVGVFTGGPTDEEDNYMDRVSSDYKNATSSTIGNKTSSDFYWDASGDDVSLSDIFEKIAQASGGSANDQINESAITELDIVSASFSIPKGSDVSRIKCYTAECSGKSGDYLTFEDPIEAPKRGEVTYTYFDKQKEKYVTETKDIDNGIQAGPDSEHPNAISAHGFDFVKLYCGYDAVTNKYFGYKLILEFPITVNPDAVGGAGAATNMPGSGIYITNGEGERENIVTFNQPSVNMPTNLWIQKSGLSKGESAMFTVQRILTQYVTKTKVNNVYQYTVTDESQWEDYTKVLITGAVDSEGNLLSPMAKLTGLSSDYYYRVIESDTNHHSWSWSYDSNAQTAVETYNIDHNPIRFSNQKNTKSQGKHYAESKAINYFGKAKDQETINSREHFTNKNQSE